MKLPRNRWLMTLGALLLLGVPTTWLLARERETESAEVTTAVRKGDFKVVVTNAGELRAVKFVQVQGPPNSQQAESYQMKIASIVPEGTIVKEGDLVAELDRSAIAAKRAEVFLALTKAEAQLEQAQLDSALNLSKAREEMKTMELALEERRIEREQAQFEAPSMRRQADIAYEKAERALAQAKLDYKTKTEQAQAKMREVGSDVQRQRNKINVIDQVMQGFTIRAPSSGMVIYVKEWNGKKKTAGSQVNAWDPTVATLPDLSRMETITYVNEIDVRKISVGHPALITLDADPTKRLTGKVTSVANVGEQRPNADAKVFEVRVMVEQSDTTLRPGMTTASAIETYAVKDALFVPLEAVMAEGDVPYVYRKDGGSVKRHEVETGAMNDDAVVIRRGLSEGDVVLLSPPASRDGIETVRLPGSGDKPKETTGDSVEGRPAPVRPPTPAPPPAAKAAPVAARASR